MNPYDEELKPGDRLTFTNNMAQHLVELGIDHNDGQHLNALVANPNDLTWQAWIALVIAEEAQTFWLKQQELRHEGEGVSSPLPVARWSAEYANLTSDERLKLQGGTQDSETLWKLLTSKSDDSEEGL